MITYDGMPKRANPMIRSIFHPCNDAFLWAFFLGIWWATLFSFHHSAAWGQWKIIGTAHILPWLLWFFCQLTNRNHRSTAPNTTHYVHVAWGIGSIIGMTLIALYVLRLLFHISAMNSSIKNWWKSSFRLLFGITLLLGAILLIFLMLLWYMNTLSISSLWKEQLYSGCIALCFFWIIFSFWGSLSSICILYHMLISLLHFFMAHGLSFFLHFFAMDVLPAKSNECLPLGWWLLFWFCLLLSNISLVCPLYIGPYLVTAGITFYPFTFLITDLLSECYGDVFAAVAIKGGAASFIAFLSGSYLLQALCCENKELPIGLCMIYEAIEGSFLSSAIAYWISQHIDIWLFRWLAKKTNGRMLWLRSIIATMASEGIDSILFGLLFFGIWPILQEILGKEELLTYTYSEIWILQKNEAIIKLLFTLFNIPLLYSIRYGIIYYKEKISNGSPLIDR